MKTKFKLITIAPLLFGLLACGPEVEEEEDVQLFERRRGTCELRCELLLDPECGAEDIGFETTQACLDSCMSAAETNWGLQDDGTDACAQEYVSVNNCTAAATCEERITIINQPAFIDQTPCGDQVRSMLACNADNTE